MSTPLPSEAKCPNCGAALGPAKAGSEYRCAFCGHVSATPGPSLAPEAEPSPSPEPAPTRKSKRREPRPTGDPRVAEALRLHQLWLDGSPGGVRADFEGASLVHADLSGANLSRANLSAANLEHAKLEHASLKDADLSRANLRYAEMSHANLSGARLSGADLRYASNVDLSGASAWTARLGYATVVGGPLVRRLVARTGWTALAVVVPLVVVGAPLLTKSVSCTSVFGPDWDNVGGPPIVAAVAGGEVVVGRLRNVGRDDQLYVGAFDGATAKARWKVGPFGTYGQAYRSTHFTVSGQHVVVTDYHAKAHIYDLETGTERHTVALTDWIDGAASVWPIPPDKAGLAQVDGRRTILDLSTGAATEAPAPAASATQPGAPPSDGVALEGLPRIPGFAPVRAYSADGTIVAYGHKAPGTPTPMVVGLDAGAASPRWQLPVPVVDSATVRNDDMGEHTSAVHGDWFVGVYGVGQRAWHVTAIDTREGARQWDVVLRPIFSVDSINGLIVSTSRVYIVREESLEVRDASSGALVGTIGSETYK